MKTLLFLLFSASVLQAATVTCVGLDDSAQVQAAVVASTIYEFPVNGTCVTNGVSGFGSNVTWHLNGTVLKHKSGDTANIMVSLNGANNFTVTNGKLDANGVGVQLEIMYVQGSTGLLVDGVTFQNTGASTPRTGGLLMFQSSGTVQNSTFTTVAAQLVSDGGTSVVNVTFQNNTLTGATYNAIYSHGGAAGSVSQILNNTISTVTGDNSNGDCGTNTGECGNGIDIFNLPSGAGTVSGNTVTTTQWSCVRDNNSSGATISNNHCTDIHETAIYCAELGGQGCKADGNVLNNVTDGMGDTNIGAPGSGWVGSTFTNNSVTNSRKSCFHLEGNDTLGAGNTCNGAPYGATVGFGGTGYGNSVKGATFTNVTIPVAVDKSLSASPNSQIGVNTVTSSTILGPAVPLDLSTILTITGITNANPAVVTYTGTNPTNGNVFIPFYVYGMTQINGQECTVASVNTVAKTFQCSGINSTGYGVFAANPAPNITAGANLLYTSGTTLAFSMPSTVIVNNFVMSVAFSPSAAPTGTGAKSATLTVTYDGGATSTTTLTGTGTAPAAPALSLTSSAACGSSSLGVQVTCAPTLTLQNTGNASGTISTIAFGANASSYSYTATAPCNSLPATLTASASCTLTIKMLPAAIGGLNTVLTVTDTPDSLTATSSITGLGIDPNVPALVNVTTCAGQTYSPSATCTIPATTAGDLIVVGITSAFGFVPTVVSITGTGVICQEAGAARSVDTNTASMSDIEYCSTTGGTTVLTPTLSGTGRAAAVIWEFTKATQLDQSGVLNSQAASATPSGPSLTASSSNEVLISVVNPQISVTGIHAGNPCTNDSFVFSGGWAHLITSSTGPASCQWDASSSGTFNSSAATFRIPAVAANTSGGISLSGATVTGVIIHQ